MNPIRRLNRRLQQWSARLPISPARLCWLLMGLAHMPGLTGAWYGFATGSTEGDALGSALLLTAATIFFGLKVLDLPALRFHTDPRSVLALGLVVGLLHLDVLRPVDDPTLVPEYTAVVATTCAVLGAPLVRRLRSHFPHSTAPARHLPVLTPVAGAVWLDAFRPRSWVLALRLFLLRAPPVC